MDIWKNLDKNAMQKDVLKLLGDWHTGGSEPGGPTAWGRSGDEAVANGAEVCWEKNGGLKPMSLQEMDEAEKEVCIHAPNFPLSDRFPSYSLETSTLCKRYHKTKTCRRRKVIGLEILATSKGIDATTERTREPLPAL